jgi:hypothetical protein
MFEYRCQYCGKGFISRRPPHSPHAPNYCSKQCADDIRRKYSMQACIICGKKFTPNLRRKLHCSKNCMHESHRRRAIVNCAHCGKPFSRENRNRRYCSSDCYGQSMLGKSPRKGKEFTRAVRRAIRQRDQNQCVLCGSTIKLEFDHIVPASLGGDNSINNGQLLCHKCHREKSLRQRKLVIGSYRAKKG